MAGEPTLSDGNQNTKTIYSTEELQVGEYIRLVEKVIPFRDKNIYQHLGREGRTYKFGGRIFESEGATDILTWFETWFVNGTGLVSGTLTLAIPSEPSVAVFIESFSFERLVGYENKTYHYNLTLRER